MFESGVWLHIIFGVSLGIATTIFVYRIVKILKNNKSIPSYVGSLVLFSLAISFVTYLYTSAISGGILIEWQPLGHPISLVPEEGYKIIEIVEVGYMKSQSGKIYHWTNPYSRFDGRWEEVNAVVEDPEQKIVPCNNLTLSFLPKKREDFVDFKKICVFWGLATYTTAYAVDERGEVYLWYQGFGEYSGLERVINTIYGGTLSCGFGVFLILVLCSTNHIRKKFQQQKQMESK
jgi:hypothetical protein